jgi:hypothetical protein
MLRLNHPWEPLLHRRDLLRAGAIGVSAALFPEALAAQETGDRHAATAKSVILLWMAGGVTHIDSFDPKPSAPEQIRGTLSTIDTTIPGIRFTEVMPCLAKQTHRLALVRSFAHGNNDHLLSQAWALSGRKVTSMTQIAEEPNVGAFVSKLLGPRAGFPAYLAVPGTTRPGPPPYNLFVGGWLGREHAPFPTGGAPRNEDFTAHVAEAPEDEFNQQALKPPPEVDARRLDGRRSLRVRLESSLRAAEASGQAEARSRQYQGAFAMLTAPAVRRAFELEREPEPTRARYGKTKIGQRCLLARRLVEAGARFVMVDYGNNPQGDKSHNTFNLKYLGKLGRSRFSGFGPFLRAIPGRSVRVACGRPSLFGTTPNPTTKLCLASVEAQNGASVAESRRSIGKSFGLTEKEVRQLAA